MQIEKEVNLKSEKKKKELLHILRERRIVRTSREYYNFVSGCFNYVARKVSQSYNARKNSGEKV